VYVMLLLSCMGAYSWSSTYREPREPAPNVESETFTDDEVGASIFNQISSAGINNTIAAIRLISDVTPLHSNPSIQEPKDVTLHGSGDYVVVGLQVGSSGSGLTGGLSVIDVTNVFQPSVVSELLVEKPIEVAINGDFVFISGSADDSSDDAFTIVDITNKAAPSIAGSTDPGAQLFAIAVESSGDRAYAADVDSSNPGVTRYDTSTKSSPTTMNTTSNFDARSVRLAIGGTVFVTDNTNKELKAFDAPLNNQLGAISISVSGGTNLGLLTLDTEKNLAFVGESGPLGTTGDNTITMVDITDPANMQIMDTIDVNDVSTTPSLQAMQVHNGQLFVSHAEGSSNETAFVSIIPYKREKFLPPEPIFTGDVNNAPKVHIGSTGDGPVDGLALHNKSLFFPLLSANGQRGSLVVTEELDLIVGQ